MFEGRRDRFEAAFRAWKEHTERKQFVELLEAAVSNQEGPNDAARASEPLQRFFGALAKNEVAQYRQFTNKSPSRCW